MVDPDYAKAFYADDAFPQLRPRPGEIGYAELGYDREPQTPVKAIKVETLATTQSWSQITDWVDGWKQDPALERKSVQ